jgi:hypothetical protein
MNKNSSAVVSAREVSSPRVAGDLWINLEAAFKFDGSWRDVYVLDTTRDDWLRVIAMIEQAGYPLSFEGSLLGSRFPEDLASLFPHGAESLTTTLSFDVGSIRMNCHFFVEDNIEFDLDPRQVVGESEFRALLYFMAKLSQACGKPALLAPENLPIAPLLTVLPEP